MKKMKMKILVKKTAVDDIRLIHNFSILERQRGNPCKWRIEHVVVDSFLLVLNALAL